MLRSAMHPLAVALSVALSTTTAGAQSVAQARVSPVARATLSSTAPAASGIAVAGSGAGVGCNLAYTSLTSAAIFALELATLFSLVEDGRTESENTVIGVVIGAPVLQIIATTLVERAFSDRAP